MHVRLTGCNVLLKTEVLHGIRAETEVRLLQVRHKINTWEE